MRHKLLILVSAICFLSLGYFLGKTYHLQSGPVVVSFKRLPGWNTADMQQSLKAFKHSCSSFVRQDPTRNVGTDAVSLQVKDWLPACKAALQLKDPSTNSIREFFKRWFKPVEFYEHDLPITGLFTGYYLPTLHGSLSKTKRFNVPIYGVPQNLITLDLGLFSKKLKNKHIIARIENNKIMPFHSRKAINTGKLKDKAKILVWVDNRIDRLFLDIQGSGVVKLSNGNELYISYEKENGRPYTALAGVFIKKGLMTRDNASMQRIRKYLAKHPKEMDYYLNQNESFVFYRKLHDDNVKGAQGVTLTSGYSLAVDRKWIPLGTPIWLATTRPDVKHPNIQQPFHRLMLAQDTGGAINGRVRGDVYWGGGADAAIIAGHMKNPGRYWLLLPKQLTIPDASKDF